MHIALGYRFFDTSLGYHLERALLAEGHAVTYVGLAMPERAGFGEAEAIATQMSQLKPDLFLWIDPAGRYFPRGIEQLDVPTACYLIDAHIGHWRASAARFFDIVFLAQKRYVEPYRLALGHQQVHWLPLAAADDVHRDHQLPRIYEIGFVGNLDRAHTRTPRARRLALLRAAFALNPPGPHDSASVGRIYSQSKIVFNTSIAGDVTMRLFEGAACGALVLTDPVPAENGLAALFTPDELVTYQDDDDLLRQARAYLADDAARNTIARAGQARVLGEHTYRHRARSLRAIVENEHANRVAPMRSADATTRQRARLNVFTHLHMLDAVMDETRGAHPIKRLWSALPCIARRVVI